MEQRLSLITLGVSDLGASRAFYERLGWKAHADPANEGQVAFFQLNGFALSLFPRAHLAQDGNLKDGGPNGFGGIALAYNVSGRDEVHRVMDQARAAGAVVTKEPQDVFWGGYNGYFLDPDGYAWEVAYNPFFRLDVDGNFYIAKD